MNKTVLASHFFDLGGGGIRFGEEKPSLSDANQNHGNLIADHEMHDLGQVCAPAVGIQVFGELPHPDRSQPHPRSLLHIYIGRVDPRV